MALTASDPDSAGCAAATPPAQGQAARARRGAGRARGLLAGLCLACAATLAVASPDAPGALAAAGLADADCPAAPPTGPLLLDDALVRALCQHPSTRQSWAAVRASTAEASLQQGMPSPVVEAVLGAGRAWERERASTGDRSRATATTGQMGVDMQWVLYDFGQRQARSKAADHALLAARASHQEAMHQVMLDTAQAYFRLLQAQAAKSLLRESERFNRELLVMALRPRTGAAAIDRLGEMQARTALSSLVLDLRRADAQVSRARGELATRLGLPPTVALELPPGQLQSPDADFEPAVASLMDLALAQHPLLQAARARLGSAQAELEQARRANRPVLRMSAAARHGRDVFAATLSERSVGLQIEIPLFAGRDQRARVHQAQAQIDDARAGLQQARQEQALAVWVNYQNLREELAALQMIERWGREAEALLSAETAAFLRDDSDMFDVLDAHASVIEARTSMLDSQTALAIGRFQLGSSLGRMAWPRPAGGVRAAPGSITPGR